MGQAGHRTHTLQCHHTLSHLPYLWHCYGYILFAALVSEVWEPPCPVTPTVHLPPTHRHCNLCWYYTAWQRQWVTKSTADSASLKGWDRVFLLLLRAAQWCELMQRKYPVESIYRGRRAFVCFVIQRGLWCCVPKKAL